MTAMNGRRGAVVHDMGAIDMALWDLRGKKAGKPLWQLLGPKRDTPVVPYASLQPGGTTFAAYRDALCRSAEEAKRLGFKAVKAECTMNGPYAYNGMHEDYSKHTQVVAAVREAIGPDMTLMVDVQYLWRDARRPIPLRRTGSSTTSISSKHLSGLISSTSTPSLRSSSRFHRVRRMARHTLGVSRPDGARQGECGRSLMSAALAASRRRAMCAPWRPSET